MYEEGRGRGLGGGGLRWPNSDVMQFIQSHPKPSLSVTCRPAFRPFLSARLVPLVLFIPSHPVPSEADPLILIQSLLPSLSFSRTNSSVSASSLSLLSVPCSPIPTIPSVQCRPHRLVFFSEISPAAPPPTDSLWPLSSCPQAPIRPGYALTISPPISRI